MTDNSITSFMCRVDYQVLFAQLPFLSLAHCFALLLREWYANPDTISRVYLILFPDEPPLPSAVSPHTIPHNDLLSAGMSLPDQLDARPQTTQHEEFSTVDYLVQADAGSLRRYPFFRRTIIPIGHK